LTADDIVDIVAMTTFTGYTASTRSACCLILRNTARAVAGTNYPGNFLLPGYPHRLFSLIYF